MLYFQKVQLKHGDEIYILHKINDPQQSEFITLPSLFVVGICKQITLTSLRLFSNITSMWNVD